MFGLFKSPTMIEPDEALPGRDEPMQISGVHRVLGTDMQPPFPDDTETWDLSDQFMIGDSLMVAPVVSEGATTKSVYFPAGTWYDVWTGDPVEGGRRIDVDAPLGRPPVFSRGEDRTDIRDWASLTYDDCR